jgi:hypothetical protein
MRRSVHVILSEDLIEDDPCVVISPLFKECQAS